MEDSDGEIDFAAEEANLTLYGLDADLFKQQIDEFRDSLWIYSQPLSVVLIILYVLLFIAAFFGNLSVLIVILRYKQLKKHTSSYMLNLALADLIGESSVILVVLFEFLFLYTSSAQQYFTRAAKF